jgi:hypothetical protein
MINNNPEKWRMFYKLSASFVFTLIFLAACKKKDTSIGAKSIDPNSVLNSIQVDTFKLNTYTVEEDSVITSSAIYGLLGSYNDPVFGTCEASIYTQLRLASAKPDFGDLNTIVIDSFILGLEYSNYYGDLSSQNFVVNRLTGDLNIDSTYYSFTETAHAATNLILAGHEVLTPKPNTDAVIGADTVKPQLRIYLDTNLARELMIESTTGFPTYDSNEEFLKYFKGLRVGVSNGIQQSGEGTIMSFNLDAPLSKLTIYYRLAGVAKKYDFLINSACSNYNNVNIDNTGTVVESVINTPVLGKTKYFAQAGKSRAVVDMPGLKNLPKNAIIHEATLRLPIAYQTGYKYSPGEKVSISIKLEDKTDKLYALSVTGIYNNFTKEFEIDLRAYVQAITSAQTYTVDVDGGVVNALINGTEIYITPLLFNTAVDRIEFNGANTTNKNKPKLVVKYTKF